MNGPVENFVAIVPSQPCNRAIDQLRRIVHEIFEHMYHISTRDNTRLSTDSFDTGVLYGDIFLESQARTLLML